MRYLITGSKGQLGYDVKRELLKRGVAENDIFALDIEDFDITEQKQVLNAFYKYKPDYVFHCAAYTNVDKAEEDIYICKNVNILGTENMTIASEKYDAKIIYVSTDYVFDGTKKGLYEIDDKPNPQSVYGATKYGGEEKVKQYPKHFIARTSWVFGINGKNFVKTMLRLAETNDEISVVADQFGSPTYTVDLAKTLVDIMSTEKYGTYHVNNEGYCDWATFAEYIFKSNNKDIKVNHIPTSEYKTKAVRPLNSRLSKKSLDENGFDRLPSWESAIDRYNDELKSDMIRVRKN